MLCALGISQLSRINEFKLKRNKIFQRYENILKSIEELTIPVARKYVSPMWHLYHIHVDERLRKNLYNYLHSKNIFVQVNYLPAHWHPVFRNTEHISSELTISEKFYKTEISLPIYSELNLNQVEHIGQILTDYFK